MFYGRFIVREVKTNTVEKTEMIALRFCKSRVTVATAEPWAAAVERQ
jgi:hypothetical protein